MMSTFTEYLDVAVAIALLARQPGKRAKKSSAETLVVRLNDLKPAPEPKFRPTTIRSLQSDLEKLTPSQIEAIERLLASSTEHKSLANLHKLAQRDPELLPPLLRESLSPSREDWPSFGGLKAELLGCWRTFYFSAVDREREFKPEIRSVAMILRANPHSDQFLDVVMFSAHTHWEGRCFLNDSHLYIQLNEVEKRAETSFQLVNRPLRSSPYIAGIILSLDRQRGMLRPASATMCFAERSAAYDRGRLTSNSSVPDDVLRWIQKVLDGHILSKAEENEVRSAFCQTYRSLDEFSDHFPDLHRHIASLKTIKQEMGKLIALHFSWQ